MRSTLPSLAHTLETNERTLRRAVADGTLRCYRPSPRRLEFSSDETDYLMEHWKTLCDLRRALRTEPNVSLAVLYGSYACGDERLDSDLDILIALRRRLSLDLTSLASRLESVMHRRVDVAYLPTVQERSPLLLLQALDEGRVLIDREHLWPKLQDGRASVSRAASRYLKKTRQEAAEAIAELLGEE